jgi:putative endonuclease
LKRRYKNRFGEIDIIALKRKTIIAIEVKARKKVLIKNKFLFDEVVSFNQRQRIKRAAILFIKSHKKYHQHILRFDLIVVSPYKLPLHLTRFWE